MYQDVLKQYLQEGIKEQFAEKIGAWTPTFQLCSEFSMKQMEIGEFFKIPTWRRSYSDRKGNTEWVPEQAAIFKAKPLVQVGLRALFDKSVRELVKHISEGLVDYIVLKTFDNCATYAPVTVKVDELEVLAVDQPIVVIMHCNVMAERVKAIHGTGKMINGFDVFGKNVRPMCHDKLAAGTAFAIKQGAAGIFYDLDTLEVSICEPYKVEDFEGEQYATNVEVFMKYSSHVYGYDEFTKQTLYPQIPYAFKVELNAS